MHSLEELDDGLDCLEAGERVPGVAHFGGSVMDDVRGGFYRLGSGAGSM